MILVQKESFDPAALVTQMTDNRRDLGAVVTFLGLVRDFSNDQTIKSMTLEHYPGMTEKMLSEIEANARNRWPLSDVLIVHRYGRLLPGDPIVFVATASAHRRAAYEANMFLMDWLKTRAPFWKEEEHQDGTRWVTARGEDDRAAAHWERSQP